VVCLPNTLRFSVATGLMILSGLIFRNMLHEHKAIQFAAKQVLDELYDEITPKSSERSVATFAANRLSDIGYPDTWYHACPALVLAGSNSCLSVSGRDYIPDDVIFGSHNLITVDLSPCTGPIWGDCARSFAIENGLVTKTPEDSEFIKGINTEYALHEAMQQFVTPSTSFHDLHEFINELRTHACLRLNHISSTRMAHGDSSTRIFITLVIRGS